MTDLISTVWLYFPPATFISCVDYPESGKTVSKLEEWDCPTDSNKEWCWDKDCHKRKEKNQVDLYHSLGPSSMAAVTLFSWQPLGLPHIRAQFSNHGWLWAQYKGCILLIYCKLFTKTGKIIVSIYEKIINLLTKMCF